MKYYRVNEIFYSLQGEGAHTGTPMVFIRMSGCNRACSFCDTDFEDYSLLTAEEIATAAKEYPTDRAVITGGEPLLQLDDELIDELHMAGLYVHVETNGTLPVPDGVDWVTCSPKEPPLEIQPNRVHELKIVNTGQSIEELMEYQRMFPRTKLRYLQPCSEQNIQGTVMRVLEMRGWRLSLQTHKILDIQ